MKAMISCAEPFRPSAIGQEQSYRVSTFLSHGTVNEPRHERAGRTEFILPKCLNSDGGASENDANLVVVYCYALMHIRKRRLP